MVSIKKIYDACPDIDVLDVAEHPSNNSLCKNLFCLLVTPNTKICFLLLGMLSTSGCFLTKVISVPMRVGGAVVSVVPLAGNSAHDAIDEAAEVVDKVPL